MFSRRDSHRPSIDLITTFRKSFPALVSPPDGALSLATPVATSIEEGSDTFMSFDPHLFGQLEEEQQQQQDYITTPGVHNVAQPTSQAGSSSINHGYLDFPSPWHQSPSNPSYFTQQMPYPWPAMPQQRFPTPSSRSLSLPSSSHIQQPAYLSLQDVQLQPTYQPSQFDFNTYQHFSPQPGALSGYGLQTGGLAHGPSSSQKQFGSSKPGRNVPSLSEFRFQASLINGTAMVKEGDIPVSYLNKRQTYKIVVRDSRPERHDNVPTTYRTFVRVSFHEEKQRSRPDQHWQLWKEGRGMNEAQQHGGKLQAIEYVAQSLPPGQHSSVHLEKVFFDGFVITWTAPNAMPSNGLLPQCELHFRCNFLSTDFSRSKGVKGIPVRLCAKNEVVGFPSSMGPPPSFPEVCYCKIKLFRDHGAERKLTNDEAAVKRLITKTEEQLKQAQPESSEEVVLTSSGKRRLSNASPIASRPSKMPRTKRASSVSSEDSSHVPDSGEGDLSQKLNSLVRLLRSRQEVTAFFLRGDESDDPDLHPVFLRESTGPPSPKASPELKRDERRDTQLSDLSSAASPKTLHVPVSSQTQSSNLQLPTPITSHHPSSEWTPSVKEESSTNETSMNKQKLESPVAKTGEPKLVRTETGTLVEAVDVDPAYRPPSNPPSRPAACFFVRLKISTMPSKDNYHRAIYLHQRTFAAFMDAITKKANVNPLDVAEVIYAPVNDTRGMSIHVDDDVIMHLPERQDMQAEFLPTDADAATNQRSMSLRAHTHSRGSPRYTLVLRY